MIETQWIVEQQLVRHTCIGNVSFADLFETLSATVRDARFAEIRVSLWDLRSGDFDVNYEGLAAMVPAFLRLTPFDEPARRVAWVVNYHFSDAVIEHFYQSYPWPSQWQVFQSMRTAESWARRAANS